MEVGQPLSVIFWREVTKIQIEHVVEAYEKAINEDKIVGTKCLECKHVAVPPRPICRKCGSSDIEIVEVDPNGELITWTVIFVGPPTYEDRAPYIVGIVELENGERLTGLVDIPANELKYKMKVSATFDPEVKNAARLIWKSSE